MDDSFGTAFERRGSAEGVSSYRIFDDEAYPQQEQVPNTLVNEIFNGLVLKTSTTIACFLQIM
jgi:hypothetical protein